MTDQHQGHTIDDVTDRIEQLPGGLLAFDEDPGDAPSQDEAAPEGKKNSPSEQEQPDEAEEPEKEEKTDKDDKPEAEDSEDDKSEDETASEEDDPVYEIDLPEGEKVEVPISELAAGYLKSRDVETQKAEAETARQEYERRVQELPNEVIRQVQHLEAELSRAIEQWKVQNPVGDPPPVSWLDVNSPDYDSDRYHYELAQYNARLDRARQAEQQGRAIEQYRAQQQEQERLAHRAQEQEKLKAAWPEVVNDKTVEDSFYRQAKEHYGFTREQVDAVDDHKSLIVLRDAIRYREMKAEAPKYREKVKAKPKPVRAGPRKTPSDQKRADTEEQRKRLRKTGRPEDAMAVFERLNL